MLRKQKHNMLDFMWNDISFQVIVFSPFPSMDMLKPHQRLNDVVVCTRDMNERKREGARERERLKLDLSGFTAFMAC